MVNLYNNIIELCDAKGIKPGKMCVDTGISKGLVTDLKMGRKKTIQIETAKKIADYFGVTVDRVMGVETEKAAPVSESGLDADEMQLLKLFVNAPEWKKKAALAVLRAAEDGE